LFDFGIAKKKDKKIKNDGKSQQQHLQHFFNNLQDKSKKEQMDGQLNGDNLSYISIHDYF